MLHARIIKLILPHGPCIVLDITIWCSSGSSVWSSISALTTSSILSSVILHSGINQIRMWACGRPRFCHSIEWSLAGCFPKIDHFNHFFKFKVKNSSHKIWAVLRCWPGNRLFWISGLKDQALSLHYIQSWSSGMQNCTFVCLLESVYHHCQHLYTDAVRMAVTKGKAPAGHYPSSNKGILKF